MRNPHVALGLCLLAVGSLGLFTVGADGPSDQEDARRLKQAGEILPLEVILATGKALHPGEVIELEFEHEGGRYIYELDLVGDDGIVWEIELDAKSGEILNSDPSD